jgi:hypothetical protein
VVGLVVVTVVVTFGVGPVVRVAAVLPDFGVTVL